MTVKLRPAPSPTTTDKGAGAGRHLLHAYPPGSDVALCGRRKARHPNAAGPVTRCPSCETEAARQNWIGR